MVTNFFARLFFFWFEIVFVDSLVVSIKKIIFFPAPRHSANDIQYNDTQHNDIKHYDTQHNDLQHNDIQQNGI